MNKARIPVIAGNWKMNKTPFETKSFINELIPLVTSSKREIILCVPYTYIAKAKELTALSNIKIGAQNCYFEKSGAFTGEISAFMLKEMGVEYVILGHSERRNIFSETNFVVNKKIMAAVKENLKVIFCVGETLKERKENITFEVILNQLKNGLNNLKKEDLDKIIIAYEPVWAIGTGQTASVNEAEEICSFIRKTIGEFYDINTANKMIILYGGSMNLSNSKELLSMPNIDGGLIGGASLDAKKFAEIINCTI